MIKGATLYPSALGFGATWNPALIEEVGKMIGQEARAVGCHQGLAPVLDVARDARWGRTEETFGEDPYLCGLMATQYRERSARRKTRSAGNAETLCRSFRK